jgi:Fic family protein
MTAMIPTPDTFSTGETQVLLSDEQRIREHRAEYRRMVRALAGPLDDGYTATFILTPADFDRMAKDVRRQRLLAKRRADMEAIARGEI